MLQFQMKSLFTVALVTTAAQALTLNAEQTPPMMNGMPQAMMPYA